MTETLTDRIDTLLPQTQCQQCGYPGCRPYAEALAQGQADINRCPPGGSEGIRVLAELLVTNVKPLDPHCGNERPRQIAVIVEQDCIGCTKCLPPCPVDAIIGAAKHVHTVIAEHCTGCALCIAPCPVNCIVMQTLPDEQQAWTQPMADRARQRHLRKNSRLVKLQQEKTERIAKQKQALAKLNQAKTGN